MKKLISILMMLAASLTITAVASAAEAPAISLDAKQLTAAELEDYGAVDGKDAYLVDIYMTGVDANRTSGNTVTGRVLAAFELTVKTDDADLIDWENSYVYESSAGAELVAGDGAFQISSGEPSRNASFPNKGETIAADEEALFASVLMYIPAGETLTFDVYQLSCVFSTYASGKIADATLTKIYNMANPASPITCSPMTVTLGAAGGEEEDTTNTFYYEADLAAADTATGFCFKITSGDITKTTETFDFVTDIVAAESVTVGLELYNIPAEISADAISVIAKLVF